MASEYDPAEFVDNDFQAARRAAAVTSGPATTPSAFVDRDRAPTREEVDTRVSDMQNKLAELRRTQQELERERGELEETRRRQSELTQGRQEMEQHLTRGVALLEEAEFSARRDAEQMSRVLADLREALTKVQAVHEESWTKDNFNAELTRALTAIENARMEWNSARLKFPLLNAEPPSPAADPAAPEALTQDLLRDRSYAELCKMGLALTWPVALIGLALVLVLLLHR